MDKTTNMKNSIQSIISLLLQPQVTKLQQEQPCDFVVPRCQALWTMICLSWHGHESCPGGLLFCRQ